MKRCLLLVFLMGLAWYGWPQPSLAAEPKGISITPATQNITLAETEASKDFSIALVNHTDAPISLELAAQDFGGLEGTGGLFWLGAKPDPTWDNHRLASWISVSPTAITLAPQQEQAILVSIQNGRTLTPGGHYAAVVAKLTSPGDTNLAINQAVSSLLFVNKQGGEVYGISLAHLEADIAWWGQLGEVSIRFSNTGNTHMVPRGLVILQDPFKRTIAKGVINQTSTTILPKTKQVFTVQLSQSQLPLWPGMYNLSVAYRYDGQDQLTTQTKQVFLLGWVVQGLLIIGLIVLAIWLLKRRRNT